MDFLLLTRTAAVLPPSRAYCHNRTGSDSGATQPMSVCFVLGGFFNIFFFFDDDIF